MGFTGRSRHSRLDGKDRYLEGTVRDITEEKSSGPDWIKPRRLEAIGTLAGGIAHDFNNILQPIIGYTEMALNALSPSNPCEIIWCRCSMHL